jgi:hypothetical protein
MNVIGFAKVFGGAIIGILLGFITGRDFVAVGGIGGGLFIGGFSALILLYISQVKEESL